MLTGSPALAGPPEIQQSSCEEAGGTFGRERGVKSCTSVTTAQVLGPLVTRVGPVEGVLDTSQYTGVSRRVDTVETTTTQSQKGNGEVTQTVTSATVATTVSQLSCTVRRVDYQFFGGSTVTVGPAPASFCAARNLFLTA